MKITTRNVGLRGENTAREYLKQKGFSIIQSNFNSKFGEIDLIAMKEQSIYFYEVKLRKSFTFGFAAEAIHTSKVKKLAKTVDVWLGKYGKYYQDFNVYLNGITIQNDEVYEYEIL